MKYQMYKFLTDRNPDGSVSYSQEDMEIIADEYQFEQNFIKEYIAEAYDILLNEIRKQIVGIAEFAYNDENRAVHLMAGSGNFRDDRFFCKNIYQSMGRIVKSTSGMPVWRKNC